MRRQAIVTSVIYICVCTFIYIKGRQLSLSLSLSLHVSVWQMSALSKSFFLVLICDQLDLNFLEILDFIHIILLVILNEIGVIVSQPWQPYLGSLHIDNVWI